MEFKEYVPTTVTDLGLKRNVNNINLTTPMRTGSRTNRDVWLSMNGTHPCSGVPHTPSGLLFFCVCNILEFVYVVGPPSKCLAIGVTQLAVADKLKRHDPETIFQIVLVTTRVVCKLPVLMALPFSVLNTQNSCVKLGFCFPEIIEKTGSVITVPDPPVASRSTPTGVDWSRSCLRHLNKMNRWST